MDKNINKYVFSNKVPFNLEILKVTKDTIKLLGEVKSIDIFQASSNEFNPEGLFSTEIFGKVGSSERNEKFGYIDLGLTTLHPLIYETIISLKQFYKQIIEGKAYAKFDPKLKDFVEASIDDGETGFNFFIKYYDSLQPEKTNSKERENKIKLIKKYMLTDVVTDKWLVLPAGLRDYIVKDGKPMENEINNYYREIIKVSKTAKILAKSITDKSDPILNIVILKLIRSVTSLYDYILGILEGKQGFLQGKWAKRALAYGTRNVITSIPLETKHADEPVLSFNETMIGLYQFVKGLGTKALYELKTKLLDNVFSETSTDVFLINPKTLKLEQIPLSDKERKTWLSPEGLEELTNKLHLDSIKLSPVTIEKKYYLYLVVDTGDTIELYRDITEVPEDKRPYVRPINYAELFFLAVNDVVKDAYATVTRYPIDSYGSIYFSRLKLKVTVKDRKVKFKPYNGLEYITINNYPRFDSEFYNSMSVHVTKLPGLGGDYDGDMTNLNIILTEEAKKEVEEILGKREYYIDVNGSLAFPVSNLITDITLKTLTE